MSAVNDIELQNRVAELRQRFDRGFASPEQDQRPAVEHMLAVRVGEQSFAVNVSDISGLTIAKGTILAVPSGVPALVGITGIRGLVVPVFSVASLLGFQSSPGQYRWLILNSERQGTIGLAVDDMEGHLEIPAGEIIRKAPDSSARYICQTVRDGETLRGVIDIPALVREIRAKGRV